MSSSNPIRAVLGLLVVGAFVYFTFFAGGIGSKVTNGPIEVYYKDGATKEEAERLAAHLAKLWAGAPDARSVQLTKSGDTYRFRMVVKKEFQNDDKMLGQIGIVGARIAREVLNGANLEVEACDERLNTVRAIPIPDDFRNGIVRGKIEVFYSGAATEAEAGRLAAHLAKIWAEAAEGRSVQLTKAGDAYRFRMAVKREFQNDPKMLNQLGIVAARIARDVLNDAALEVEACDEGMSTVKAISIPADFRHGIVRGKIEVFHSATASKPDATKLMDFLEKEFAAAPAPLLTFALGKRGATNVVSMAFKQELLEQPEVLADLRGFRERLSQTVFKGEPLELNACDDSFNVTKTFKPEI